MPSHEWLRELFTQLAFVSSVLGGFAVAFLGTLLTIESNRRIVRATMGAAAIAAAAFMAAAVMAAMSVAETVRLGADNLGEMGSSATIDFVLMIASFLLGFVALMVSVGLSGWIRSTALGILTTGSAAACALMVTVFVLNTD